MKAVLQFNIEDVKEMIRERLKKVDVGFEWKEPKLEFKREYYREWFEVTIDSEAEKEVPECPVVNVVHVEPDPPVREVLEPF